MLVAALHIRSYFPFPELEFVVLVYNQSVSESKAFVWLTRGELLDQGSCPFIVCKGHFELEVVVNL